MLFKFSADETQVILKACEGHSYTGKKPGFLEKVQKSLSLSGQQLRELVRYLQNIATVSISGATVGCGIVYRRYMACAFHAMKALDVCNSVKYLAGQTANG